MKDQIRYTVLAALFLFAAIWSVSMNYSRILYAGDYIASLVVNAFDTILPGRGSFVTVSQDNFQRYERPYGHLSEEFFHSGRFFFYRPVKSISVKSAAEAVIKYTDLYSLPQLEASIKKYNAINGDVIEAGKILIIPECLPSLIEDAKNYRKPEIVFTSGIYLSGQTAGSRGFMEKIPRLRGMGINAVVFDIKDVTGIVNHRSGVKEVIELDTHKSRTISNIQKLIRELKKHKIYSIARVSVFHDQLLARRDKSMAIRSRSTGGIWANGGKEVWCDPTSKRVQDYNIKIAVELAELGVDEIQFDYIRFPTTGDFSDAVFAYDFGKMSREDTITNFLQRARREISARNANLSIDIFGVVAWGKDVDIRSTGQSIGMLAKHCDVISPMLYPSHFNDEFDGRANPGDHPYYFIYQGCKKVADMAGSGVKVRPWLQAFTWRVSNYNAGYILEQIKASNDSGAHGYLFWNASNQYDVVFKAINK